MNKPTYISQKAALRSITVSILITLLFSFCSGPKESTKGASTEKVLNKTISDSGIAKAELYTKWFFSGQIDSMFFAIDEPGKDRFPDKESLSTLRSRVIPILPGFDDILNDSIVKNDSVTSIWRYGINSRDGAVYYVKWNLNPRNQKITGFSASDAGRVAPSPAENYKSKTKLRLPFEGEWIVFWGGRTVEENYHAAYPRQRFAMDLMPAEDSLTIWRAAKGEATVLEDFSCFGSSIIAPASGKVVRSLDTVSDNPVGKFHPTSEMGNHLIIEHDPGEYSLFAHLKKGSLQVSSGDKVEEGQKIAECGNSGRTTAPHLHYDLVNDPEIDRGTLSLPAIFYNYYADSILVEKGEPVRWQRIENNR